MPRAKLQPGVVAGFVLAGGESSRMGQDKALALFRGIPLVRNALDTLEAAGAPGRIAGSRSSLGSFAPEIADTFFAAGPLGGIHAALCASSAEWNLFLPVDLPLMPSSLLSVLLQRAMLTGTAVTAAKNNGRIEPFPVVLHRDSLPEIDRLLEAGETACHLAWRKISEVFGESVDGVSVENLVQSGQCSHPLGLPSSFWFQSANTPGELALLHQIYKIRGLRLK